MSEEPVVSPVLLWEIAIKVSLGKLTADVSRICQVITEQGFERLGYFDRHMISLQSLPNHHRNPLPSHVGSTEYRGGYAASEFG